MSEDGWGVADALREDWPCAETRYGDDKLREECGVLDSMIEKAKREWQKVPYKRS